MLSLALFIHLLKYWRKHMIGEAALCHGAVVTTKYVTKPQFIMQQKQTCFVLVWKKELADIWNVSPLNISVMFGFPYKVYSCSPTDVLPTDVFTLFMTLTWINSIGMSIGQNLETKLFMACLERQFWDPNH